MSCVSLATNERLFFKHLLEQMQYKQSRLRIRIIFNADPEPDPDPDPAFHCNAYANPATHQCDGHLRPLIYLHIDPPRLHCERLRPSKALFGLLNFDINADPGSSFSL
jgi:hypothetical protein